MMLVGKPLLETTSSSTSTALQSLFVYGTLMAPEVIQTLIDRIPVHYSARLLSSSNHNQKNNNEHNKNEEVFIYKRHPVKGHLYPGLITTLKPAVFDVSSFTTTTTASSSSSCLDAISSPSPERNNMNNDNNQLIEGILYQDLTIREMQKLDWFEDIEYTKYPCTVQLINNNNQKRKSCTTTSATSKDQQEQQPVYETTPTTIISSQVYMWTHPISYLDINKEWCYENFYNNHLQQYLHNTVIPCRKKLDELGI